MVTESACTVLIVPTAFAMEASPGADVAFACAASLHGPMGATARIEASIHTAARKFDEILDKDRIAFTLASRTTTEFRLYEVLPALTRVYTIAGN
jgi:hypothetical protein